MTDYLEELLSLLPQESEEEAAGQWQLDSVPAAGLLEPVSSERPEEEIGTAPALKAERPRSGLDESLSQAGPAALDVESGMDAGPSWLEEESPERAARPPASPLLQQETAQLRTSLAERPQSRQRPALLEQAQALERTAAQAQTLAPAGRGLGAASALVGTSRARSSMDALEPAEGNVSAWAHGIERRTGGEDPARLVDRAFQRDSRRYDRGFSLY